MRTNYNILPLLNRESVYLTRASPTEILEFLLIPSITAAEYVFHLSPSCLISHPILVPSVLCAVLLSWTVSSTMIIRYATGTYPTCHLLCSASHQCSLSSCSMMYMSVYPCCRSISFPIGLSGFFVYDCVGTIGALEHIFFTSICLPVSSPSIPYSPQSL